MKAPKRRKRGPGGGRKAQGPIAGKSANFSTRITPETRGALEAEAKLANQSVSQMAEQLMKSGLSTRRARKNTDPLSALAYLVSRLADDCVMASPDGRRFEWNTDPFINNEFQVAVSLLIEHLRPQGESTIAKHFSTEQGVHSLYREVLEKPGTWGKHVFLQLWDDLCSTPPQSPSDLILGAEYDVPEIVEIGSKYSQYSYDLDRARRALGFRKKKS